MAKKTLSFEAALQELETLATSLEKGDIPLEAAIQAYEKSQKLIQQCEHQLEAAQQTVYQLVKRPSANEEPEDNASGPLFDLPLFEV
jgi:exodeoxyribonuclease VII small subunit